MPAPLENKLKSEAAAKGYTGKKADAFVYGTLRNTGWKPQREQIAKTKVGASFEKDYHK